jgi:hypothetical protein
MKADASGSVQKLLATGCRRGSCAARRSVRTARRRVHRESGSSGADACIKGDFSPPLAKAVQSAQVKMARNVSRAVVVQPRPVREPAEAVGKNAMTRAR